MSDALLKKYDHYFTEKPSSPLRMQELRDTIRGFDLKFITASGVFSSKEIDTATKLLCEKMIIQKGWRVLDLGCGIGVLGIIAGKLGAQVVLSDINERALMLARKNLRLNSIEGEVVKSFAYKNIAGTFDAIITNPPRAAGLDVCYSFIDGGKDFLNADGLFQLVARHTKGGERLMERMKQNFGNVATIAKKGGFRVYTSKKNTSIN